MSCPIGFDCQSMTGLMSSCPNQVECSAHASLTPFSAHLPTQVILDRRELASSLRGRLTQGIYEIDFTVLDCYLVNHANCLSRPHLTTLIDSSGDRVIWSVVE